MIDSRDRLTIGAEPSPNHPTAPRSLRAVTFFRLYSDQRNMLETLESVGSVVTTLSTIGATVVRTGR